MAPAPDETRAKNPKKAVEQHSANQTRLGRIKYEIMQTALAKVNALPQAMASS
jgi:hypothetical protein